MPVSNDSAFGESGVRSRSGRDKSFCDIQSGVDVPDFAVPYRPTVKDKLVFHSINVMKVP